MMASAWSVALVGLDGQIVEVEADIGGGLPRTVLVGLPDTALYEARDRCKAAVSNSAVAWPASLLTINLSPATLPKTGSHYDLAIVAAVLGAADQFAASELADTVLLGELGLDGRVRGVRGILPATLAAAQHGFRRVIVPRTQAVEARLVDGIEVFGVASLRQLLALLRHDPIPDEDDSRADDGAEPDRNRSDVRSRSLDLADVAGQAEAKWALEVAAAGRHHIFFHGPPGSERRCSPNGCRVCCRISGVADALEVSAIHSLAGVELDDGLIMRPPYADPHHSASMPAVIGGGPRMAKPGAISRAHRGVLFMDEAPEFSSGVLEAMRTPLESGIVFLTRSQMQTRYPARFQLVLAANPCPVRQVRHAREPIVDVRRWRSDATARSCRIRSGTGSTSRRRSGRHGGPGCGPRWSVASRRRPCPRGWPRRGTVRRAGWPAPSGGATARSMDRICGATCRFPDGLGRRRRCPRPKAAEPARCRQGAPRGVDGRRPGRCRPSAGRSCGDRAGDASR